MAFKIRDEGDMLEHNLRFHHALGVDHFIVTDNGSTDETVDILARYAEAGLMTVIEAPNTDYREQGAKWMTDMARLAATELGADWVVHTDADEFWWPIEGSLSETLAAVHDRYGVLMAPRCEFIGRPDGPGSFAERLTIREARSRYQPKVAHRADPDVVSIDRGPHDVAAGGSFRGRDRDDSPARPAGAPRDPQPGAGGERVAGGGHAAGVGAVVARADPPLPGPLVGAVRAPHPDRDLRGHVPRPGAVPAPA